MPSTGEEIEFVYSPLNNKVYAFGGIDNISIGTAYNLTRIYDIATGTWSTGAPMPLGRQQMGSGYWQWQDLPGWWVHRWVHHLGAKHHARV